MKICIIGAGAGGRSASGKIRELDKESQIDIFSKQSEIGYAPCELPFAMRGTFTDWDGIFYPGNFFEENGVNVHLKTEVTDILRDEKRIIAGGKSYAYDKLILSLGARPLIPDIPGVNGKNEFAMSSDISRWKGLDSVVSGCSSAAVIGSGAIGIETTQALKERGYQQVYLLEIMDHILPSAVDQDIGQKIEKVMADSGVDLILSARIKSVVDESGKKRLILEDRELEVDLLIFATGAEPDIGPAEKAGIRIGETGAVYVNEYLQTSDPDIYAIGDCMEHWDVVTGAKTRRLMVTTARITGSIAGTNLVQGKVLPYRGTTMTFIMDVSGHEVGAVGFTEEKAKKMGFDVTSVLHKTLKTRPAYDGKPVYCKLIADRRTKTLLGGQIVSKHEIAGMINELAVVFAERVPIPDISQIDTPYSPLIGPDPVRGAMARLVTKLNDKS
jgi:NADPH-dependent 2,4-dienoyl-CoA reductase/sulfur reductase-like enzyme